MQETWVWSLGWEDPLEKGMANHSSIMAWRIPWTVWGWKSQTGVSDFHFHSPLKWSKEAQLSGEAEYLQEEVEFLMVESLAPSNLNC